MKPRIMVVDDDAGIRQLVRELLQHEGYEVTEAATLLTLRQALNGDAPDAIILDLNLPDGNGLDALPQLKKGWPDAKVIILTGHGTVEVAEEAYRKMENVYIQSKPFDPGTLQALLDLALAESPPAKACPGS